MIVHTLADLIKGLRKELYPMLQNAHFWILLILILTISFFYYTSYSALYFKAEWLRDIQLFEYRFSLHGSLLYITFVYAAIVFVGARFTVIWLLWILSFAIILPRLIQLTGGGVALFTNILFLIGPMMLILLIVIASRGIENRRRSELERETQRQAFMAQILKAQENERKYIAQELHDDTIQTLLALINQTQLFLSKESGKLSSTVEEHLFYINHSISAVADNIRRLCVNLRPSVLDDIGFLAALRSLVDNVNNDSIKARLIVNGENRKLPPDTDVIVYRFVQEALTNVTHHSEASEVVVSVDFGTKTARIKVQDNGKGVVLPASFSELAFNNKLGIIGMQERAKLLGGNFNIQSELGNGTSVSMEF